jgi:molecular chaperone GrpE
MSLENEKIQEPSSESGGPEAANGAQGERPKEKKRKGHDEQFASLQAEIVTLRDQMVRSMAEAQNVQRRMREQHEEALKFAAQPLVTSLLPVLDNLERSLASLEMGASPDKVLEGVRAIDRQLRQVLASVNVERIDAVGKDFNPKVHEALTTTVSEEHRENTVLAEIEPGYTMHGRVIRPARVQVNKKP